MKNQAFTLIEILVVVLIIGILAAIAVPQYQKAVVTSRYNSIKVLAKNIADAQELYYAAHSKYALTFAELDINMPIPVETTLEGTKNTYNYDWGYCRIGDYTFAKCSNSSTQMDYQINFKNISWLPGKRLCVTYVMDLSSIQAQLCKQETGTTTPSVTGSNYKAWTYIN